MEVINLKDFHLTAIEHANDPRNMGPLREFNGHARITGPCGDTMEFWLQVHDGKIKKASFATDGCDPSIASGSMTTCLAEGKTIDAAKSISQKEVLEALEGLPEESQHCALLAVNTLKAACDDYMEKQKRKERI
jgi:nitrogen fixation NifU-like protein